MQKLIRHLLRVSIRWIAITITLFIAYLSLINTTNFPVVRVNNIDKAYHFVAYFTLTFSWLFSLKSSKNQYKTVFFCVVYGVLIEILQAKITIDRSGELLDFIANTIGGLTGLLFFRLFFTKKSI